MRYCVCGWSKSSDEPHDHIARLQRWRELQADAAFEAQRDAAVEDGEA